jgi:hypothetical protein
MKLRIFFIYAKQNCLYSPNILNFLGFDISAIMKPKSKPFFVFNQEPPLFLPNNLNLKISLKSIFTFKLMTEQPSLSRIDVYHIHKTKDLALLLSNYQRSICTQQSHEHTCMAVEDELITGVGVGGVGPVPVGCDVLPVHL